MSGLLLTLGSYDQRLLFALVQRRRRFADVLMRAITHLGDPPIVIALTLGLWLLTPSPLREAGEVAAAALAGSHLFVQLLKRSVVRSRPALPVGLGFLVEPQDRFSFHSGHAAAGLSVALPLFLVLSGWGAALALVLGLFVGVSRCYLGVHYPGDVLMGWSLAALGVLGAVAALGVAL